MRILLVSLFLVEYPVELANALGEKHQVHLVLSKSRASQALGDQLKSKVSPHVSLTLLPYRVVRDLSTIWCAFRILKLYLMIRPHVVHVQECSNPLNLLFFLFHFRPLFTTIHDVNLHPGTEQSRLTYRRNFVMRILRRYFYGTIIVHGEELKNAFLKRYKKAEKDVYMVPHGCLFSYLPERCAGIDEEAHTVLFFGRMEKYKGLKYLMEAEPLVSKKIDSFKIVVAGQGEDLNIHKKGLCLNPHFEVHDRFIPFDEVPAFFQRSSVVVLPYIEASQSGIVAMAFAFGKPVIATDVGSLGEVVKNGDTGLLVSPGNAESLADAIIYLLNYSDERKKMGERALRLANTTLSWKNIASITESVYRRATHIA